MLNYFNKQFLTIFCLLAFNRSTKCFNLGFVSVKKVLSVKTFLNSSMIKCFLQFPASFLRTCRISFDTFELNVENLERLAVMNFFWTSFLLTFRNLIIFIVFDLLSFRLVNNLSRRWFCDCDLVFGFGDVMTRNFKFWVT